MRAAVHAQRTRSRARIAWVAFALALAASLAVASTPARPVEPAAVKAKTEQGAIGSIPAFTATALDGTKIDLAKRRGRWQVVNFWATWCAPCIKEIPELWRFDKSRDDVEVLGLAFEDSDVAEIRAFLDKHPAGYPMAHVDPYAPLVGFAVPRGLPTTYLIAPDGRIAERLIGPVDGKLLARAIAKHSGKPAAAQAPGAKGKKKLP